MVANPSLHTLHALHAGSGPVEPVVVGRGAAGPAAAAVPEQTHVLLTLEEVLVLHLFARAYSAVEVAGILEIPTALVDALFDSATRRFAG